MIRPVQRGRAVLERARALRKPLGRPRSKVDEVKIRRDYEALRSERKVAELNRCSDSTVPRIVPGIRSIPREIPPRPGAPKKNK